MQMPSLLRSSRPANAIGLIHTNFPIKAMSILLFLKSLFAQPSFSRGQRVNLVQGGSICRTDGYVVGQSDGGVLVEWPRGGASVVSAIHLSLIG